MNVGVKVLVPLLVLAMLATFVLPVSYAEPMNDPESLYKVVSTQGVARMWVEGELVEVEASIDATVKIVTIWKNVTFFAVTEGEIRIGDRAYNIVEGWWVGLYHIPSGGAIYQGFARSEDGDVLRFILHSRDLGENEEGGTLMRIIGGFGERYDGSISKGRIFFEAVRIKLP